jgi:hypothetical protein
MMLLCLWPSCFQTEKEMLGIRAISYKLICKVLNPSFPRKRKLIASNFKSIKLKFSVIKLSYMYIL